MAFVRCHRLSFHPICVPTFFSFLSFQIHPSSRPGLAAASSLVLPLFHRTGPRPGQIVHPHPSHRPEPPQQLPYKPFGRRMPYLRQHHLVDLSVLAAPSEDLVHRHVLLGSRQQQIGTGLEQRSVGDAVGLEVSRHAQFVVGARGHVQGLTSSIGRSVGEGAGVDDSVVGDHVGPSVRVGGVGHLVQNHLGLLGFVRMAGAGPGGDDRGVRHRGGSQLIVAVGVGRLHKMQNVLRPVRRLGALPRAGPGVEDRGEGDGGGFDVGVPGVVEMLHAKDHLLRPLRRSAVAALGPGVDDGAVGDDVGFDAHVPGLVHALHSSQNVLAAFGGAGHAGAGPDGDDGVVGDGVGFDAGVADAIEAFHAVEDFFGFAGGVAAGRAGPGGDYGVEAEFVGFYVLVAVGEHVFHAVEVAFGMFGGATFAAFGPGVDHSVVCGRRGLDILISLGMELMHERQHLLGSFGRSLGIALGPGVDHRGEALHVRMDVAR
mmetsp:Transcript_12312/g.26934  ORF Transcript_12312/g.26934 Transcript_12312/m.26934 type:complete len:485 (-) Transcript_12312:461-1915(-)